MVTWTTPTRTPLALLGLLGGLSCWALQGLAIQTDPCALRVALVDLDGEAITEGEVTLISDTDGAQEARALAEDGVACFRERSSGTLVATASGFAVATGRVRPTGGAEDAAALRLVLEPAYGERVVVSATGTDRRLADVPVHIQQIDRSSIEASAARTLADAVEYTSGIRIESNCQNCNFSQVRMLGLEGPYSQILVDGQPSVSSLAMVYGIEQIPARLLDGIEVVKGGGSALYGASAVGGTINLLPHQPDHVHVEADGRYIDTGGEPGYNLQALADLGNAANHRMYSLYAQLDRIDPVDVDADGFSEVASRDLAAGGGRFSLFPFGQRAHLSGDLNLTSAERRGGDLLRFDLPPDQTELTEWIETRGLAASVRLQHLVRPRFEYRAAFSYSDTQRDSYYGAGFDSFAYGTTQNPLTVGDLQLNHYLGGSTVTWGAQFSHDQIDDFQPGYGRRVAETYTDLGLYAQDDRSIGKGVTVLWGARVDDHSALADPVVSPRLAALWSPTPSISVRTTLARGFRPPALFDEDLHIELVGGGQARVVFLDPNLKEETSLATLLGAEWRPTFGRLGSGSFELNLFRTRLDDLFYNREADDPTTPELELLKVNLGGATVQGVEIAGSMRWGSQLVVDFGVVSQRAHYDEAEPDFGSTVFFRTPDHYGSLGVQWSFLEDWTFFGGLIYTGEMIAPHYAGYIEVDRLERTTDFLTLDMNVMRRIELAGEREIRLTLGARNLTNEFQPDLDQGPNRDSAYVYGPRFPRQVFLGVGLTF